MRLSFGGTGWRAGASKEVRAGLGSQASPTTSPKAGSVAGPARPARGGGLPADRPRRAAWFAPDRIEVRQPGRGRARSVARKEAAMVRLGMADGAAGRVALGVIAASLVLGLAACGSAAAGADSAAKPAKANPASAPSKATIIPG